MTVSILSEMKLMNTNMNYIIWNNNYFREGGIELKETN
jgi:hypothetical protein